VTRSEIEVLVRRVDVAARSWEQGDAVLGDLGFLHRFDPRNPLTESARQALVDGEDLDVADTTVLGLVVLTQTCDILRSCVDRPFVEVCPLVLVTKEARREVEAGLRPRFAYVAGVAGDGLAADLDRVMTMEKSMLLGWKRVHGCRTDADRRRLASALARKRGRCAFPDDFVEWVRPLLSRWTKKHAKLSHEGHALRAIREIRVRARPSWDASPVALHFVFIADDGEPEVSPTSGWERQVSDWMERLRAGAGTSSSRFDPVEHSVVSLDDLSARDYVESDPLDLDHLSHGTG